VRVLCLSKDFGRQIDPEWNVDDNDDCSDVWMRGVVCSH
jgi:hypothetical protein